MTRRHIHTLIYFLSIGTIAVCMTMSVWACNLAWVVLLANWLVEWIWNDRESRRKILSGFKTNRLLQAFVALFLMYVVGLLWSSNWSYGLDSIRKCFPLIAIPMVLLTADPLNDDRIPDFVLFGPFRKERSHRLVGNILFCYIMGILAASIVGLVRYFTIDNLPYRDIIPFLSHIRFSLNLCMGITLLVWQVVLGWRKSGFRWTSVVAIILALYFLFYLFLLQSYTGLFILTMVGIVSFFARWNAIQSKRLKRSILTLLIAGIVSIAGISIYFVNDYYQLKDPSSQPLRLATANGNPYQHLNDGLIENGNYVNNYLCDLEMEREWAKRSALSIHDTTPNGYTLRPTLIRYLNAMGKTKDSLGMTYLTTQDVEAIEKGIANPVYLRPLSLKRMYSVMLYEYESYRCYHAVKGFTMLQRFELWKNGFKVFTQHPLFGVGTGDVVDLCHQQLETDDSPLKGTTKHCHNQYLTYLITFGLFGFALILFFFTRAFRKKRLFQHLPFLALMTIFLISCLTEDTLETLAGIVFFVFFCSLFSQRYHFEPHN